VNIFLLPYFTWQVISVDMAGLLAGQVYHGQFEARVKNLLREVKRSGKIILFIDEVHTLVGAGTNKGSDVANVFKPALARGELQVSACIMLIEEPLQGRLGIAISLILKFIHVASVLGPLHMMSTGSISRKMRRWKGVSDLSKFQSRQLMKP